HGSPKRYRNRENPFSISRGYYDLDEVQIEIPDGYAVEALPAAENLSTEFGEYFTKVASVDNKTVSFTRSIKINSGRYKGSDYDNYRQFLEKIARNDNSKIILTQQ